MTEHMIETLAQGLARLVAAAAQTREDSWDQAKVDALVAVRDGVATPEQRARVQGLSGLQDCYGLTLRQAAAQVCAEAGTPEMEEPVYLLLAYTWGDSLDWAEAQQSPA